jgi:hypothetical protein
MHQSDEKYNELQSNVNLMYEEITKLKDVLNLSDQKSINNNQRMDIKNFMSSIEGDLN